MLQPTANRKDVLKNSGVQGFNHFLAAPITLPEDLEATSSGNAGVSPQGNRGMLVSGGQTAGDKAYVSSWDTVYGRTNAVIKGEISFMYQNTSTAPADANQYYVGLTNSADPTSGVVFDLTNGSLIINGATKDISVFDETDVSAARETITVEFVVDSIQNETKIKVHRADLSEEFVANGIPVTRSTLVYAESLGNPDLELKIENIRLAFETESDY
ncbi:hypothetical protein C440_05727 [Haloferax mucosum ATCC BAA-1512]|uniref:Uncharacterized protein n=1 Tax=Haloferax mucosum ATCC BAA-1512 TaxID=662479 RepID=M0IH21_9EURY|nr:hypothetical protein [Haloferax mucosum]ELZ96065.1 hypothetical protein C440_05727 [Haloferax mucosum ATCC BAA-1512]